MAKKEKKTPADLERLHDWLNGVSGTISLGECVLKEIDISKSGDKITIVLKKPEVEKAASSNEAE